MGHQLHRRLPSSNGCAPETRPRSANPRGLVIRQGAKTALQSCRRLDLVKQRIQYDFVVVSYTPGRPPSQPARLGTLHSVQEDALEPRKPHVPPIHQPLCATIPRYVGLLFAPDEWQPAWSPRDSPTASQKLRKYALHWKCASRKAPYLQFGIAQPAV